MAKAAALNLFESIRPVDTRKTGFLSCLQLRGARSQRRRITALPIAPLLFAAVLTALALPAAAQESVIAAFTNNAGGCGPWGNLILDSKGNLYGTNSSCGTTGFGTVFQLTPNGAGEWTENVLYTFTGDGSLTGGDGALPDAALIFDSKGNLYGTTSQGGAAASTCGTVFKLSPPATSGVEWTETILHSFDCASKATDGYTPTGSLIFDAQGNLYGTTQAGGAGYNPSNQGGTVFELSPPTTAGGAWTETVLYSFHLTQGNGDGCTPKAGLVSDTKGNLYGTAYACGTGNAGGVFELTPHAGAPWTEQMIHSFVDNGVDGYYPLGSLTFDSAGNLYGTTDRGGQGNQYSGGTVFEMSPGSAGAWSEQILHNFALTTGDGVEPHGSLTLDSKGNVFGTTAGGGSSGTDGLIFELTNTAGTWSETIVHNFLSNGMDGTGPFAGVTFDTVGNLYTTTSGGGTGPNQEGAVIEILSSNTTQQPQFSPAPGTYHATQKVTISDTTPDSTIYYTVDGATPTTSSTKYTGAITVADTETIKAIATASGLNPSPIATAAYTIQALVAATPVISPAAGTYSTPKTITITDATSGASIYYTTNDTTPTTSSTKYTAAFKISESATVKAIAVAAGYTNSAVASSAYIIAPLAATPVISPKAGTYESIQDVAITDATKGATIYYTTNGAAPTTSSTKYTAPISVSASETIQAFATAAGDTKSEVATAAYTLVGSPSVISGPATAIGDTDATLNANVNTLGLSGSYLFQYGTSATALTTSTAKTTLAASKTTVAANARLTTLKAKTKYYFQVVVTTAGGTSSGSVLSFTTE